MSRHSGGSSVMAIIRLTMNSEGCAGVLEDYLLPFASEKYGRINRISLLGRILLTCTSQGL